MEKFPGVQFYDYTKIYKRALMWAAGKLPKNYHVTYSLNEDNKREALYVLKRGGNISAVFRSKKIPKRFHGYKVTNADKSDWIFCLVRTDPNVKKQEGISFLLIDMESEGVSTSPIELISGESEFRQTFFDNVKVPKENIVGELNKGWSVAKALLKHERKLMSEQETPAGTQITPVQAALDYVGTDSEGKVANRVLRDQLVQHEMKYRALGLTHFRSFEEKMSGAGEGNIPMIMKYVGTECTKEREETLIAMLGTQGLGWEGEGFNDDELLATRGWLFSKALSIAGGSSEVQLNIIAKRILGLPE